MGATPREGADIGIRTMGVLAGVVAFVIVGSAVGPSSDQGTFEISGEVEGLYPGVEAILEVRVTNPHPFVIEVNSVTVAVRDANSRCPGSMLTVEGSSESVEVPPEGTVIIPLTVEMDVDAPDACQSATWPLVFMGAAVDVADEELPSQTVLPVVLIAAMTALLVFGAIWAAIRRRAS